MDDKNHDLDEMHDMPRPLLAITMGDPAGVGPETVTGVWREAAIHRLTRLVVVGNAAVMRRAAALLRDPVEVVPVDSPDQVASDQRRMPCLDVGSAAAADVPPARIDPRGGQAAYDALIAATKLALAGQVDGIVTAPLHKAALHAAGHHYPGHTELLAELCGVREFGMMLYLPPVWPFAPRKLANGGTTRSTEDATFAERKATLGPIGLGVVHVTLHMAMRDVFEHLTVDAIVEKIRLANVVMQALKTEDSPALPRIGVAALNPHAGEKGLFGDEEIRIIRPAVERAIAEGLNATGPLPCDTLMVRAAAGEFDAVVAMYHDQGHIALKLLDMHRAVNITLGLPIVRTSVAHGTAFDLAWQGKARTTGMVEAIRAAAYLARHRERLAWRAIDRPAG